MKVIIFIVLVLSIVYGQTSLYTTLQTGQGTYYGTTTAGACSYYKNGWPNFFSNNNIIHVALNSAQYGNSLPCGTCIRIVGSGVGSGANPIKGDFIAVITDLCPECPSPNLDFALNGDGRWNIQWYAIDCPVTTNVTYLMQGSNNWYVKLQTRDNRYPVQSAELAGVPGSRTSDNFFVFQMGGAGFPFPATLKLTDIYGQQVVDTIGGIKNDVGFAGLKGAQFPSKNPQAPTIGSSSTTTGTSTTTGSTTGSSTTGSSTTGSTTGTSTTGSSTTGSSTTGSTTTGSSTTGSTTGGSRTFTWNTGSNSWWLGFQVSGSAFSISQVEVDCGFGRFPATQFASWDPKTVIAQPPQQCTTKTTYVYIAGVKYQTTRP